MLYGLLHLTDISIIYELTGTVLLVLGYMIPLALSAARVSAEREIAVGRALLGLMMGIMLLLRLVQILPRSAAGAETPWGIET